jgi:DNA-binding NarL/FixJ family response regulator
MLTHNTPALRVLVADDHPVVRAGIVALLSSEPSMQIVSEVADGREALEAWGTVAADVGLVDLSMPRMDGFETISAIRRVDPDAKLVVMTTLMGDEDVFRALKAGAMGFLLKDCAAGEIADCLRSAARGQKYLHADAAARLADRVTRDALTLREREVLAWLTQGLSNKQIARHLDVSEGTIKTHVKSILSKLDARSRTEAARTAARRGLVHDGAGAAG